MPFAANSFRGLGPFVDHTWSWLLSHVLLLLVDYLPMSRSKYTGRVMQANPSHELWRLYEV